MDKHKDTGSWDDLQERLMRRRTPSEEEEPNQHIRDFNRDYAHIFDTAARMDEAEEALKATEAYTDATSIADAANEAYSEADAAEAPHRHGHTRWAINLLGGRTTTIIVIDTDGLQNFEEQRRKEQERKELEENMSWTTRMGHFLRRVLDIGHKKTERELFLNPKKRTLDVLAHRDPTKHSLNDYMEQASAKKFRKKIEELVRTKAICLVDNIRAITSVVLGTARNAKTLFLQTVAAFAGVRYLRRRATRGGQSVDNPERKGFFDFVGFVIHLDIFDYAAFNAFRALFAPIVDRELEVRAATVHRF